MSSCSRGGGREEVRERGGRKRGRAVSEGESERVKERARVKEAERKISTINKQKSMSQRKIDI